MKQETDGSGDDCNAADKTGADGNDQSQCNHTDDQDVDDRADEIPVLDLNDAVVSETTTITTTKEHDDDGDNDNDNDSTPRDDQTAAFDSNATKDTDSEPSLACQLDAERAKSAQYEQRLALALADYQNLSKRTASEIESGTTARMAGIMTDMVAIRDDFARARDTFAKDGADTAGLDSIMKNLDSALQKYDVAPIDALGEIFDPDMHEAVSTEVDPTLDENTITREVRRGYMLKNTIIRPTMVVISKKE